MKNPDVQNSVLLRALIFCFSLAAVGIFLQFYFRPFLLRASQKTSVIWKVALKQDREGEATPQNIGSVPPQGLSGHAQLALGGKIDINRAGVEDLAVLPGVGFKMAERIVQDRTQKGSFRKVKDLMRVKGIKEKKFAQIQSYVTVEP